LGLHETLSEAETFVGDIKIPVGIVDEIPRELEKARAVRAGAGHTERFAMCKAVSSLCESRSVFTGQKALSHYRAKSARDLRLTDL
jgi:hypothetical protein